MASKVTLDDGQLKQLIISINALHSQVPYWKQFFVTTLPIFLAALLWLTTALLLDWLKTRRECKNLVRERLEKELALLSGVNTAIAFNISTLIHTVMQQILPHYKQSYAAKVKIAKLNLENPYRVSKFHDLMH